MPPSVQNRPFCEEQPSFVSQFHMTAQCAPYCVTPGVLSFLLRLTTQGIVCPCCRRTVTLLVEDFSDLETPEAQAAVRDITGVLVQQQRIACIRRRAVKGLTETNDTINKCRCIDLDTEADQSFTCCTPKTKLSTQSGGRATDNVCIHVCSLGSLKFRKVAIHLFLFVSRTGQSSSCTVRTALKY